MSNRIATFIALVLVLTETGAAAAQQTGLLEEVVVTARKRAESLQDVPIAVSAFSDQVIESQTIQEFMDIDAQVPGLYLTHNMSDSTIASPAIRGQRVTDVLLTNDSPVGLYIDGVNMPRMMGLNANIFDIERLEVLKGPQGTLFGRNTTAGAIQIITRKADSDGIHGYLRGSYGNENYTQLAGAINLPVADSAALRLAIQKTDQDGFAESEFTGQELADQDEVFVRGSFVWDPTDRLNIQLTADYLEVDEAGLTSKLLQPGGNPADPTDPIAPTPSFVAATEDGIHPVTGYNSLLEFTKGSLFDTAPNNEVFSEAEHWGGGLTVGFDINEDLEFKSITGYRNWESNRENDLDGSPYTILHALGTVDADFFSQELQLQGASEKLDWVVGAYYSEEEGTDGSEAVAVLVFNPSLSVNDGDVKNETRAVFAQGTYALTDSLNLTAGYRWTKETKDLVNMNRAELVANPGETIGCTAPGNNWPDGPCEEKFDAEFDDPSWLLSLDYTISDGVMVYGSASRSWRGGGHNLRAAGGTAAAEPFGPETATNYEVGLKGEFFGSKLRTSLAAYFTDYEDIQQSIIIPGAVPGTIVSVISNAAEAEIIGFEVEAWLQATEGLSFFGTVGYVDFEYQDFNSFAQDGVTIVDRSDEAVQIPEWQWSVSGRYDTSISGNDLGIQVDYAWTDEINHSPTSQLPNIVTSDSYGLLNARIDFMLNDSGLVLSLWGRNLTDEEVLTYVVDLTGNPLGATVGSAGRPRQIGATIEWKFGGT